MANRKGVAMALCSSAWFGALDVAKPENNRDLAKRDSLAASPKPSTPTKTSLTNSNDRFRLESAIIPPSLIACRTALNSSGSNELKSACDIAIV